MSIIANSSASFLNWQPSYAERGIATFPVDANKRPMVRHYGRFGLGGSGKIASRFADAPAIGFMCGSRSGITVLDVDSKEGHVLADALDRHGETPIVVRTGSGNYQAWYRHGGERRLIRPRRNVPIDILGGGFVVAPASRVAKGQYEFIQGGLDDLDRLPTLNDAPSAIPADIPADWGEASETAMDAMMRYSSCLVGPRTSVTTSISFLFTPGPRTSSWENLWRMPEW